MEKRSLEQQNNPIQQSAPLEQAEETARVLLLGGLTSGAGAFVAEQALQAQMQAQDLRVCALHQSDEGSARWLTDANIDLLSLAPLGAEQAVPALPEGIHAIGAGETEAFANRPYTRCVNGIRLGFVPLAEQPAGAFSGRAELLSLTAFDRVRMLLNQCDHVIVLAHSGLRNAELPLPEWRARYRRLIEVGASIVVDSGAARGWEAHQHGVVFYGLGSPAEGDSLGLFLSLLRNGRFRYEARALQRAGGTLAFSQNESFKTAIDAQNALYTDEKAYDRAVGEMCMRLYCERENAQKRGVRGLFSPHADEEAKLLALLNHESLRLMTMRAIRLLKASDHTCRENTKKA